MKALLQLINFRLIVRLIVIALLGMQIGLVIIFFGANQMKEAYTALALATWITLALLFETIAHNLKEEKENLEKFLSGPSDSEGGEA